MGGAVHALDAQIQLDRCVGTLDPVLCAGINRTPTGIINSFDNQLANIGGILTDGLDLTLSYATPRLPSGRYRVTSSSSYLIRYNESIPSASGFEEITRAGKEIGDPERGFPRLKSSLILDWFRGDFAASVTFRYIHSLTEACRGFGNYPGSCSDPDPKPRSGTVFGSSVRDRRGHSSGGYGCEAEDAWASLARRSRSDWLPPKVTSA